MKVIEISRVKKVNECLLKAKNKQIGTSLQKSYKISVSWTVAILEKVRASNGLNEYRKTELNYYGICPILRFGHTARRPTKLH